MIDDPFNFQRNAWRSELRFVCLDGDFNARIARENLEFELMCPLHAEAQKYRKVHRHDQQETSFSALLTHSWPNGTSQFRMSEQRRHARGNSRQLENFMSVNDSNPSSSNMKVWARNENVRVVSSHMVIYWLNLCIARMTRTRLRVTRNMCDKSAFVRSTHGVGLSRLKSIKSFFAMICPTQPHPIWI